MWLFDNVVPKSEQIEFNYFSVIPSMLFLNISLQSFHFYLDNVYCAMSVGCKYSLKFL